MEVDEKFVMDNCTIDDVTAAKNVVKQLVYEIYDENLMKGEFMKGNLDKQGKKEFSGGRK